MSASRKLLLVGGLAAAFVGVMALSSKKSRAATDEEEDFPPIESDEDEDEDVPAIGPLPRGRPVEDVVRGGRDAAESVLEEVRDRIVVDDLETRSPGQPQPPAKQPPAKQPIPPPPPKKSKKKQPTPPTPELPTPEEEAEEIERGTEIIEEVIKKGPPTFSTQPVPGPKVDIPTPIKQLPPPPLDENEEVELPEQPNLAPETERMLRVLLAKEATPNWKAKEPAVEAWQRKRNLKPDKMFGPQSAKKLAEETGLLPIVRFWPRTAQKHKAVPEFQSELILIASKAPEPRKSQLGIAAQREQGQGFGSPPQPIKQRIEL